jgi:hypothetical protein
MSVGAGVSANVDITTAKVHITKRMLYLFVMTDVYVALLVEIQFRYIIIKKEKQNCISLAQ